MTEAQQAVAGMGEMTEQEPVPACRACGQPRLSPVLDLGEQRLPYAAADGERGAHPLRVVFCRGCGLLQQTNPVDRTRIYHEGYGYQSGDEPELRRNLEQVMFLGLTYKPTVGRWLDIGCNDGSLLAKVPERVYRVGVDPVEQPGAAEHADEHIVDWFEPARFTHPEIPALLDTRFDVITSLDVFDTVTDPGKFVDDVRSVLAPNGVWILQQPYAGSMIEAGAVDLITPARVFYWTVAALVSFLAARGMRVLDTSVNPLHGGTLRLVVTHERSWLFTQPSVANLLRVERESRVGRPSMIKAFAAEAEDSISRLGTLVGSAVKAGQLCMLYEPGERLGSLMQAARIGSQQISGAVTRNPRLVGTTFGPVGVNWLSLDAMLRVGPEFMLVGPWWNEDQVVERERHYLATGGRLVFPLPELHVVSKGGRSVTVREDR